jgi:hypothetical protein
VKISSYASPALGKADLRLNKLAADQSTNGLAKTAGGLGIAKDGATISSAATALAAKELEATLRRTPAQERMIAVARSDPKTAHLMARNLGTSPSRVFYDISQGDIRLSSTGEPPDDAIIHAFNAEAPVVDAHRQSIYEMERAKGTDPVEIVTKLIDLLNMQSESYRTATAWGKW